MALVFFNPCKPGIWSKPSSGWHSQSSIIKDQTSHSAFPTELHIRAKPSWYPNTLKNGTTHLLSLVSCGKKRRRGMTSISSNTVDISYSKDGTKPPEVLKRTSLKACHPSKFHPWKCAQLGYGSHAGAVEYAQPCSLQRSKVSHLAGECDSSFTVTQSMDSFCGSSKNY